MRILVNDFAGHPFQVQLSRELARRGHNVLHTYLSGLQGPKGALTLRPGDPAAFEIQAVNAGEEIQKYSLLSRFRAHRRFANAMNARIAEWQPDVVLSGNTPIDAQHRVQRFCRRNGVAFIHWMQDLYCLALDTFLRRKFGRLGSLPAAAYFHLERRICREADAVVMITPGFADYLDERNMSCPRACVIENWAPLDELPSHPRNNAWRAEQGLGDDVVFLYSGTLGMKHRPELLWELAGVGRTVVVSEGIGRDYLDRQLRREPGVRLQTLNLQPYEKVPEALSSADVLVAIIDAESSRFAVPSKVLSYLCVGRPVLLASPSENLAATVVENAQAGIVVHPDDHHGFVQAARLLNQDEALRRRLGRNGRRYAEQHFDIGRIAARFEDLCMEVTADEAARNARSLCALPS